MRYFLLGLTIFFSYYLYAQNNSSENDGIKNKGTENNVTTGKTATAIFSGGCFWCTESDFEKKQGIINAVSGFTNGHVENPSYKQVTYGDTGHIEAVLVTYDPTIISYAELVDFFWYTIDPTDARGQFCDKGDSYLSAIYYQNDKEKQIIENSLSKLNENKPFADAIVTKLYERSAFYPAEDYHQDYYKKNPIRYNLYRNGCRRDNRLQQLWGES